MNSSTVKAAICASFCAAAVYAASGSVDITDFVRASGIGNYHVLCGSGTTANGGLIGNACDGITTGGDGQSGTPDVRVLLHTTNSGGASIPAPVSMLYYIDGGAMNSFDFKVTSFTLYRIAAGWGAIARSATQFRLDGYDGRDWHLLFETGEAQTWDENTLSRTYVIPAENQACYRTYLFTITANGGDASWSGFQELVLHGDMTRSRLVWNGAEGAKWNATDANWIDRAGNVTNWMPGATAEFGAGGSSSISVEGTNDVGGIVFSQTNACTITGGALAMTHGFGVAAGIGDVIASDLVDAEQVDVYQGEVDGARNYFPADPNNTKQGAWMLLWRNRNLAGITNFTGAVIDQGGVARPAEPYIYKNDGETASVQFQCKPNAILCIKVLFVQIGADVYGRVAYVNYTWSSNHALGADFDGPITERNVNKVYDQNVVESMSGAYGFYGVVPHGGEWGRGPLRLYSTQNTVGPAPADGFLPRSEEDPNTGSAVLCFPGYRVSDLCAVSEADLYYTNILKPSSVHYFVGGMTNATVQIQGNTGGADGDGARLCVKVEFTDGVGGVYARAVYARYDWGDKYAHDFDVSSEDQQPIYADGTANTGYGVKGIVAVFRGERVTFGASAITLDRDVVGDCTVRFAPLSASQLVTVPEARTVGKVAFGGATAFAFAEGASLSVGFASVEDSAAVSIPGPSLVRIGTSRRLTRDARSHILVDGFPARQDLNGWVIKSPGLTLFPH